MYINDSGTRNDLWDGRMYSGENLLTTFVSLDIYTQARCIFPAHLYFKQRSITVNHFGVRAENAHIQRKTPSMLIIMHNNRISAKMCLLCVHFFMVLIPKGKKCVSIYVGTCINIIIYKPLITHVCIRRATK